MELNYYVAEKMSAEQQANIVLSANRYAKLQLRNDVELNNQRNPLFSFTLWNIEFSVAAVRK